MTIKWNFNLWGNNKESGAKRGLQPTAQELQIADNLGKVTGLKWKVLPTRNRNATFYSECTIAAAADEAQKVLNEKLPATDGDDDLGLFRSNQKWHESLPKYIIQTSSDFLSHYTLTKPLTPERNEEVKQAVQQAIEKAEKKHADYLSRNAKRQFFNFKP